MREKFNLEKPSLSPSATDAPIPPYNDPPNSYILYRYRKQRGVNLGSWFALESWLTGSLFKNASGNKSSEKDIVEGMDPQEAKQMLESHWDHFINDGDWRWMVEHGITSVRLPIGYFHFVAGHPQARRLMKGTEYEKHAEVYEGAWSRICKAIEKARSYKIAVLVDLHGAPGAQNRDGHSGLSQGKAHLWYGSHASSNQSKTTHILVELVKAVAPYENVLGVELLNEPQNNAKLEEFYNKTIREIRKCPTIHARTIPIYLGDAWDSNHYSRYVGKNSDVNGALVMDHHLYRCFTKQDHSMSALEHADLLSLEPMGKTAHFLKRLCDKSQGALIIGEWSAAMNPGSFHTCPNRREAQKAWANAQWKAFEQFTAGYYFWTLKKEGKPDSGWGLYSAIERGVMPSSLNPLQVYGQKHSVQELESKCGEAMEPLFQRHKQYWDKQGGRYNHDLFRVGFQLGWKDAVYFLSQGMEIGLSHRLAKLRMVSYAEQHGTKKSEWEFEHGFMQAVDAFRDHLYA